LNTVPVSRSQMWLARGVCIALVALFLILKLFTPEVSRVESEGAIVYSPSLLLPIMSVGIGILVLAVGALYWRAGGIYRFFVPVLLLLGVGMLFFAPTGTNHRLIVTPDSFDLRLGFWFAPEDTKVEYASLVYMSVDDARDGGYVLTMYTKEGEEISVPIHDLLKAALPEILNAAADHELVIGEQPDGSQVPAALLP